MKRLVCRAQAMKAALSFALLSVLFTTSATAAVVINEILAQNNSAVENASTGSFPDYVELFNPGSTTENLVGWSLRDANTNIFRFPANTRVQPNGYLVVFFDKNFTEPGLHSGYGLNNKGDSVALFGTDGRLVESNRFGLQVPDLAVSRVPNGLGDFTLTPPTPRAANSAPAVRLGDPYKLVFNEWLATNSAGANEDWFELYNPDTNTVALGGLVLVDNDDITLGLIRPVPDLSYIAPGDFVRFNASGRDRNDADNVNFRLGSTAGDQIRLFQNDRRTLITSVSFGPQNNDISEGLLPDGATNNRVFFPRNRRTPGASNFLPLTNVVINEIIAHTDPPLEDAIELYNPTAQAIDISGWFLSNSKDDPRRFRIPDRTILQPNGYKVFYEGVGAAVGFNRSGRGDPPDFTLNSAHGDEVFLYEATNGMLTGFRRSIDFGSSANGVSIGRFLTSEGADFVPMTRRTFGVDSNLTSVSQFRQGTGLTNAQPLIGPVVINEIHYHPPDIGTNDNAIHEFIEIYNISSVAVPLFDPFFPTNAWRIRGGIGFEWPASQRIEPGEYMLLVNFDPAADTELLASFQGQFHPPGVVKLFGPYRGRLSNGSASVELERPDTPQMPPHPDAGFVPYINVDRIRYSDKAPWPTNADGLGLTLQRVVPNDYGNEPRNWKADAPTAGRFNNVSGEPPPLIVGHPQSLLVQRGAAATFTVVAESESPITYQWQKNGANIPGATSSVLSMSNVQTADVGQYRVAARNTNGQSLSRIATLRLDSQPPSVSFRAPAANARFTSPEFEVRGGAADANGVERVDFRLNDGAWRPTGGAEIWSALVELAPGTNTFYARAIDHADNVSSVASRSVVYVVTSQLTVSTNGPGSITPVLNGQRLELGRAYQLTATPRAGYVLSNWTGVASTASRLTFVMTSNLMLTANFVPNPFPRVRGNYNGLFCETNGVAPHSAGFFNAVVMDKGAFSGRLQIGSANYPFTGQFDLDGHATNLVARRGTTPLRLELGLDLYGNSDMIIGKVVDGERWECMLMADRAVFDARTNRAPWAGKYTLALPGAAGDSTQPGGDSFGMATVDTAGTINFAGTLSENSKASQRVPVSKSGQWPLYAPLYSGRGALASWVSFDTNQPDTDLSGAATWVKPASTAFRPYTNGFVYHTNLVGSRYVAPVGANTRAIALTNGEARFADGNLAGPFTNRVAIGSNNRVTNLNSNPLTFTITPASGLVGGTATPPGTTRTLRYQGVLLQKSRTAAGFFVGTNQSGSVRLGAEPVPETSE